MATARTRRRPPVSRALIVGAGPIGLLCALLAAQRGLEVHVVDRIDHGPKPARARALSATYHTSAEGLGSASTASSNAPAT